MDVDEFVQWLCCRDRRDIDGVVLALDTTRETADGELCRLRATRDLGAVVRRAGRSRQAGEAAHRATVAAVAACASTGLCASDPSAATRVARAAADAAVGLVAGEFSASTETVLRPFLGPLVLT